MINHRSNNLADKLITNKLSGAELDEFLGGLHNNDDRQAYSDVLVKHFNELLHEAEHPPDLAEPVEPHLTVTKPKI